MSRKFSAYLSLVICIISVVMLIVLLFSFPSFFKWIVDMNSSVKSGQDGTVRLVSMAFYIASPFVAAALYMMIRLLLNVLHDKVFIDRNVCYIRFISYCSYAVALISAVFTYYYKSMAFVAFIMAVVGTMLRVAKNVMQSAVEIRRENDLTI